MFLKFYKEKNISFCLANTPPPPLEKFERFAKTFLDANLMSLLKFDFKITSILQKHLIIHQQLQNKVAAN